YLAFYDFWAKKVRIHEYHGDRTPALAGFLRVITGFFAARGLISPSLHLDLLPAAPLSQDETIEVSDADPAFESLHPKLLDPRANEARGQFGRLFVELLKEETPLNVPPARVMTGRDAAGIPTVGYIVLVEWREAARPMSAAFFYLVAPNEFACTDAGTGEDQRW